MPVYLIHKPKVRKLDQQNNNCNFVALMNDKQKYLKSISLRIGAIFLLLLFMSTSVIPALHQHEHSSQEQSNIKKDSQYSGGEKLKTHYSPCKICDLMKHQSTDFNQPRPLMVSFLPPSIPSTESLLIIQATSSFILKCSNKGPPSFN
ncbi:hypothetical protein BFS30_17360 [Pedobacter steynii]|uniref:DUF2946 domain-containing protein n=2 Tax=Pedobacter steynii TaxID=430522 RepID=A0A1D7QJE1_9SPHI|nr:hypothetical protein BFS30_17360 [Pedobacter steynii]